MSDYRKMWQKLGLDLEAHDQLLAVIPQAYGDVYTSQAKRPEGMGYLDFVMSEIHGLRIKELNDLREAGGKVLGTFCLYVPEEIALAGGAACVGICGGADWPSPEADAVLPRNLCPLIKSFMSFKLGKVCPYFESSDMIVGETTCDGKKKAYEVLGEYTNVYTMHTPQMKDEASHELWLKEVEKFKNKVEELTGNTIDAEALAKGIGIVNAKRAALKRMNDARKANPAPISGRDALLIQQVAFYDDPIRFTDSVNKIAAELEQRVVEGKGVAPANAPRILMSGCPMAVPNWKLPFIVESAGAIIVAEESCIGHRYFRDMVDATATTEEAKIKAIADRYMKLDCACFTPNKERIDNIKKLVEDYNVDGVIHYSLQFCDPFTVEYNSVEKALKDANIPVLKIETDYSMEDAGQLSTRVEAFLETIK
ncbi:MAG TPA: double-cubane-cluster-containing anaerobic reductase [Candidatus Aquicultor sp.]|jgi:benzoyl-CoA reductase/2-hydroxyglutaryl-CoA dehydratase subunit BcrC/BadD/HgdB